jgi:hypothetical protein
MYHQKPSSILGIEDEYTAFCLDEACCYIMNRVNNGDKIIHKVEKKNSNGKKMTFKDMLKEKGEI